MVTLHLSASDNPIESIDIIQHYFVEYLIGWVCQKLHSTGNLNPKAPGAYNDVCIALLARQIGGTLVTRNTDDFKRIREAIDVCFRDVMP